MTTQPTAKAMSDTVAQTCADTASTALSALDWLGRPSNRARAGNRFEGLGRDLRRNARTASRLARAAGSPPSIGVYGASQAGKSYLIAHLAAPLDTSADGSRPVARVLPQAAPGGISFLDINPGGRRESTGLVTRFTTRPLPKVTAEFPVLVRLLTVLDLVKIIVDCYANDLKMLPEDRLQTETLAKVLEATARLPRVASPVLTQDDIHELRELRKQVYAGKTAIAADEVAMDSARYWDRVAELAPHLDIAGLAALLAPLWCNIDRLTKSFHRIAHGLAALNFATEVTCRIDCLLPRVDTKTKRELSIIDVNTLNRLLSDGPERIDVRTDSGVVQLDRPVVAALTAELVFNLAGTPRSFLGALDLLDFPGARTRIPIDRDQLEKPTETEQTLLRGKVAHLFTRYRQDFDLTSMILCVGPSTNEVGTLPELISQWVEETHGASPELRIGKETTLFLVLTKFDEQFDLKEGEKAEDPERWRSRIDASITRFLGRVGNWTANWTPGRHFENVFWYRNPFVDQPNLMQVRQQPNGSWTEVGLREGFEDTFQKMTTAYFQVPEVKHHLADHAAKLEAALTFNDGGITYLADAIGRVARPDVKIGQIQARIAQARGEIIQGLKPLFVETNVDAQRLQRRGDAERTGRELAPNGRQQTFGRALARLTVTPEELERVYKAARLREEPVDRPTAAAPVSAVVVDDDDWMPGKPVSVAAPVASQALARPRQSNDLAAQFGRRALIYWTEKVQDACRSPEVLSRFGLTADGAGTLASELIAGSSRLALADQVADLVRPSTLVIVGTIERASPTPSLLGAKVINDYVLFLGRGKVVADPKFAATEARFVRRSDRDVPALGPEPSDYWWHYCRDWLRSFIDLVEANVMGGSGPDFDIRENEALGVLLAKLRAAG